MCRGQAVGSLSEWLESLLRDLRPGKENKKPRMEPEVSPMAEVMSSGRGKVEEWAEDPREGSARQL